MNNTAKIVNDYCKKFESAWIQHASDVQVKPEDDKLSEGVINDAKFEGNVDAVNNAAENSCDDLKSDSAQNCVGAQENSGRGKASAEAAVNWKDCKVEAKFEVERVDADGVAKIIEKSTEFIKEAKSIAINVVWGTVIYRIAKGVLFYLDSKKSKAA